jgi:hypothetical protein
MLILRANLDDLELVTSATADIEVHLSAMQADASTPPVVQPLPNLGPRASITTATTTQILDTAAITDTHVVNVKHLNIYNNHASTACLCTVQVNDGTVTTVLAEYNLLFSESMVFTQGGVWIHYDANGGVYPSVGNAASQAEMEAGTATDKYVAPGTTHFHPGVAKCWVEGTANSTTILASYNITSLADTATGTQTVTIATDFSSANWCCQVTRSEDDLTLVYSATYNAKTAGVVAMNSAVEAGSGSDPTSSSGNASWSMTGFGDL